MRICNNCKWPVDIRNGAGNCDHLYFSSDKWHEGEFLVICPLVNECKYDTGNCEHAIPHEYIEENDNDNGCISDSLCPDCIVFIIDEEFLSEKDMKV